MMTKILSQKITDMISLLEEIQDDSTVPRNVKDKLQLCSSALQDDIEISLKVDKVRHALEAISEDSNLQSYARTQIWNISSMLEKL